MLHLHSISSDRWVEQVTAPAALPELLIDHAHCEKKAASVAMNLLFTYVENVELCRAMTEIVEEELQHFRMVLDLLEKRKIPFRRQIPSSYGERLQGLVTKEEPMKTVDRLLIGALIEARSCERFGLLRDRMPDRELADFFGSLFESEARHHSTYVRLAKTYAPGEQVRERLEELAIEEAKIIERGDGFPRMHS
jgi:tRNA 2-(methylsulfanyl)-N6-isopentenyladenosine37 hydroxylase